MTKSISFTDIDVSADGWIRCNVTRETTEQLRIQLPYSFTPANDLIAAALAALCGSAFDSVEIDLPIGRGQAAELSSALKATFKHRPGQDRRRRPGTGRALNFSGGFDSLAARAVLPEAHLVSLDFGGSFERERRAFEPLHPYVFRTNLVALGFNAYSWEFMGIGSILLRDELQLCSYSFGSIQAGSMPGLFTAPKDQHRFRVPAAGGLGMNILNPVGGVSEIGALSMVARSDPGGLVNVLHSVATPGSDKFTRKLQMTQAVCAELDLPIQLPANPPNTRAAIWGEDFARDLASLFVMKVLGPEIVAPTYVGGIPAPVTKHLEALSLNFMRRFNPHAYAGVPQPILAQLYARLVSAGVMPYERADWFEMATVMKLLRGQLT